MAMYQHELKDNIKDELMHNRQVINDMNDLTKVIIKIDNKLYEKVMEKKYNGENQRRAGFISEKPKGNFHKGGNRFGQEHVN